MRLKFNNVTSQIIHTPAGVPEKSPLSPMLYMLEIPKKSELGLEFIDDIEYGTSDPISERNTAQLRTCQILVSRAVLLARLMLLLPSVLETGLFQSRHGRILH